MKETLNKALTAGWIRLSRSVHPNRLLQRYLIDDFTYHPMSGLPEVRDECVQAGFAPSRAHRHRHFVCELPGAWAEPVTGRVIWHGRLVVRSYDHSTYQPVSSRTLADFVLARAGRREVDAYPTVLLLRDPAGANYWHFFDDVLPKLEWIDRIKLGSDVVVLVGADIWEKSFFQQAIRRGELSDYRWTPHTRVVRADRLIFGRHGSMRRVNAELVRRLLAAPVPSGDRRLFLTRSPQRSRHLENEPELRQALASVGFEAVDTDSLSLDEQISMFAETSSVVAVHGAGLANLIFRIGGPLRLLELFPADYISPQFAWLAGEFGFQYDAIAGTALTRSGTFRVEIEALMGRVAG